MTYHTNSAQQPELIPNIVLLNPYIVPRKMQNPKFNWNMFKTGQALTSICYGKMRLSSEICTCTS